MKQRTTFRIDAHDAKGNKKHYKSITLPIGKNKAWKALVNGCTDTLNIDIDSLRAERKRKGKKK